MGVPFRAANFRASAFFLLATLFFSFQPSANAQEAASPMPGEGIAQAFLLSNYETFLMAVVPAPNVLYGGDVDPNKTMPIDEILRDLRQKLIDLGLNPDNIDLAAIRDRLAEQLRAALHEQGLPEWLIDLIVAAFRNGVTIPNPFGIKEIRQYNEAIDVIHALEAFLRLLGRYDLDEDILSMNDIMYFLRHADRNAVCGNQDGNTSLEEMICYIQEMDKYSIVKGWGEKYKRLIDEINELRRLLGLPALDEPFIVNSVCMTELGEW